MRRRAQRLLASLLIMAAPFLVVVVVNETAPEPTDRFDSAVCTRHCHNNGCKHARLDHNDREPGPRLYRAAINWLHDNPLGISYAGMNILLFVVVFPITTIGLLYGALGPWREP